MATPNASPAGGMSVEADAGTLVYVGGYTKPGEPGIYLYRLNNETGELTAAGTAPVTVNPSFLALSPDKKCLYAVNETDDIDNGRGGRGGGVSAFAVDAATGELTLLNQQSSIGSGPCHIALDPAGRFAAVANYGSGSVAVLPIEADGRLGPACAFVQHHGSSVDKSRQEGPHAHCVAFARDGTRLYCCDLGLDHVQIYDVHSGTGALTANDPAFGTVPLGAGPRHIVFSHDGHHAYVINEMGSSVTAFDHDIASGALREIQTISSLPADRKNGNTCAEIALSPDGRHLYGSNRGHDSIAIFSVDSGTGRLRLVGHEPSGGKTPRNFAIDPSGRWLIAANQDSNSLVVFRVNRTTGRLAAAGHAAKAPAPVCVVYK